jgi:hypothetical protein
MSNTSWVKKLQVQVIDEEDGGCLIRIEWDDADPDLAEWTSWGEEGQKQFIIDALYETTECFTDNPLTEPVD